MRREAPVQRAIVAYLRTALPNAVIHHARGEINKRGADIARELAQAKSLGAVKGFPDLVVILPAHLGVLFLEVKPDGGYASDAQKAMHGKLAELGYRVAVVRSIDDVRARLAEWGVWTRESGNWQSIGGVAG